MRQLRFCLITSAHLAANPRIVKEADALSNAGHDVRVVAVNIDARAAVRDAEMLRTRSWRLETVSARRGAGAMAVVRWVVDAALQRLARGAARRVRLRVVSDRALARHYRALATRAARERADVFVAHNLEALPAAARAAGAQGARLAFDVEDLHAEDFLDPEGSAPQVALIRDVEGHYLPRCDLLLASSDGIAEAVASAYGVRRPLTVLNAFPIAARAVRPTTPPVRRGPAPSLYWFSQTLGPGRGLEDAIAALGLLRDEGMTVQMHLRGSVPSAFRAHLDRCTAENGVTGLVYFWPPAPPDEMVALAAEHDVGLALEHPESVNRALCVSNKILTYLAAGIPVAATDTLGQRDVLADAPGAGFVYPPGDVAALARGLRTLIGTEESLGAAKAAADRAARRRFSWECEARVLTTAYEGAAGEISVTPAPARQTWRPTGLRERV